MSEYVIVRINQQLVPEFQINYSANNRIANKHVISSWSDIGVKNQETLILIISANLVLTKQIKIPSKNEEIIRQSIPFALEEILANEIADNHYAYRQLSEQNLCVSIVENNAMQEIVSQLERNNLQCMALYSELFSVPLHHEKASIVACDGVCIVRDGCTGTTINENMLKTYFQLSKIDSQVFYSQQEMDMTGFPQAKNKKVDTALLQAITITSDENVNLFQAKYAQNDENYKASNPWKRIVLLIVVLLMSWLTINVYNLLTISSDINSLKEQQANLLLELIPNASETEMRDPYSAIQSRLKISQNQGSNNSVGFIQTMAYLGQTLVQHPSIQVQSLRLRDARLEVSVQAPDMSKLNAFQSSLESNVLAMRVKTGTREVSNEGVSSVITMEALK